MSVKTFIAEYVRETKPLTGDREIKRLLAQGVRLAPGGNAEVKVSPSLGSVRLEWLASAEHGKRYGSAALTWLCDLADRHKVTLRLGIAAKQQRWRCFAS